MDLFEGMNVVQELKGAEPVDLRDLSGTNQRLARVNFFFSRSSDRFPLSSDCFGSICGFQGST